MSEKETHSFTATPTLPPEERIDPKDHARVVDLLAAEREEVRQLRAMVVEREKEIREGKKTLQQRDEEVLRLQKVEDELKESESRNRTLLDAANQATMRLATLQADVDAAVKALGGNAAMKERERAILLAQREHLKAELAKHGVE